MLAKTNANFTQSFALTTDGTTPYNLTGKSVEIQFKSGPGASSNLTASTTNGKVSLGADPTLGILTINLTYTDMQTLVQGYYYFDAVWIQDASNHWLLFDALLYVTAGITEDSTPTVPLKTIYSSSGSSAAISVVVASSSTLQVSLSGGAPSSTAFNLTPQTAPPTPASGGTLYVDVADGLLKIKFSNGNVQEVASP